MPLLVMSLMAGVTLAFAFLCFGLQARVRRLAAASTSWPEVTGTVERTGLLMMEGRTTPVIYYAYEVAGRSYRANRIQFGGVSNFFNGDAYQRLGGLERGDRVAVRYDPDRPGRAVLQAAPATDLLTAIGVALTVLAVLLFLVGLATLSN